MAGGRPKPMAAIRPIRKKTKRQMLKGLREWIKHLPHLTGDDLLAITD